MELVRGLGVAHGHERSFKVSRGALLDNRFLVSLHKNSLGPAPWAALAPICGELAMPEEYLEQVAARLPQATIIHLGYEEGTGTRTYKLYLEFAQQFKQAVEAAAATGAAKTTGDAAPGSAEPLLVHLAFKWDPANPAGRTIARYTCQPGLSAAGITEKLNAIVGPGRDTPLGIASGVLRLAGERMAAEEILFMEVEEDGNPRRSFDMNLYDARLTLDAIAPLLAGMWRYFGIPEARSDAVTAAHGARPLGHLSGGIGRDSGEFFSVYFGVTAH